MTESIIVVEDLTMGWGDVMLLEHASFEVKRGEVFAILGGSGCGKSTLLRYLIGLDKPLAGHITIDGRLDEVGLANGAETRTPSELSGGMKKRAGFARALVLEPEIVMFDEPDSGLDPVRTALLCQLIEKVHAENGGTYVVITHDIASAKRIGEYIAVLWKGRIVQSGDRDDMFGSPNPFVRQFLAGNPGGPLGME
jgi:ABC-type transporter Mla maintaining outer membrane lipid asymmetry ATPase subunit MlaF